MRRGDIWTVSGGKDYAGKPRPVVIVQDDAFDATDSITICAFTTDPTEAPLFRLPVEPNERNGLRSSSRLMVDKITTVPKSKVGERIGRHFEVISPAGLGQRNLAKGVFRRAASLSSWRPGTGGSWRRVPRRRNARGHRPRCCALLPRYGAPAAPSTPWQRPRIPAIWPESS